MDRFSATRARLWESHEEPLNHTHSDTVKFSGQDVDYECVLKKLRDIASKATATLSSRYLDQGTKLSLSTTQISHQTIETQLIIKL